MNGELTTKGHEGTRMKTNDNHLKQTLGRSLNINLRAAGALLKGHLSLVEFGDVLRLQLGNLALKAKVLQLKSTIVQVKLAKLCLDHGAPGWVVRFLFHDVLRPNDKTEPQPTTARVADGETV